MRTFYEEGKVEFTKKLNGILAIPKYEVETTRTWEYPTYEERERYKALLDVMEDKGFKFYTMSEIKRAIDEKYHRQVFGKLSKLNGNSKMIISPAMVKKKIQSIQRKESIEQILSGEVSAIDLIL